MSGRFINPLPQFFDSTPTALSGCKLFFYATGTSTKLNTYTTKALSVANPNPVVLNSAGRLPNDVFLQDLEYKVVLAPSTDTDPPTSPIWTADPVSHRDSSLVAKTLTGSGSPNGVVAGTAGSASILPDFYWDYTSAILYVCTTTGTSSTAVWTAVNASSAAAVVTPPQGYLTPVSAQPVITADSSAATSIFYTPDVGNQIPIYNGSTFVQTTFTELTLSLVASHAASNIYDVFVFNNSGVPTVVTGPSWSAGTSGSITAGSCARGTGAGGTALARVGGINTNSVQITGRNGATTYTVGANLGTYVGSIFMDGTNGQITCHRSYGQSRKWGVWNAYNRKPTYLKCGDSTASWTYSTGGARLANNSASNVLTIFSGLAEEFYDLSYSATAAGSSASSNSFSFTAQVGVNGSTAGKSGTFTLTNNPSATTIPASINVKAEYLLAPSIGINTIGAYESNGGLVVNTMTGGESGMLLSAKWRV